MSESNKFLDLQLTEIKRGSIDLTGEFSGLASTFRNVDLGGDRVVPGAFRKSLSAHAAAGTSPNMLWMHDPREVIGRWDVLEETAQGLHAKGVLAPTARGMEVRVLLKMGAINGLSIGYRVPPGGADYDRDGNRLLKEIELHEISVVGNPMNQLARVATVKTAHGVTNIREWERVTREAFKWSKSAATKFASATWPAFAAANSGNPAIEIAAFSDELDNTTAVAVLNAATARIRRM